MSSGAAQGACVAAAAGGLPSAGQPGAAAGLAAGSCPDEQSARATVVGQTGVQKQLAAPGKSDVQHTARRDGRAPIRMEGHSSAAAKLWEMHDEPEQGKEVVRTRKHNNSCLADTSTKRRRLSSDGCFDGKEENPLPVSCSTEGPLLKSSRARSSASSGCVASARGGADVCCSDGSTGRIDSKSSSAEETNITAGCNSRTHRDIDRDCKTSVQKNKNHGKGGDEEARSRSRVLDGEHDCCDERSFKSSHRSPSAKHGSSRESAIDELNSSTSIAADNSKERGAAVENTEQVNRTAECSIDRGADTSEDAGSALRYSEFCSGGDSSPLGNVIVSSTVTTGRSTTSGPAMNLRGEAAGVAASVAAGAGDAGDKTSNGREKATTEKERNTEALLKEKEGRDGTLNSFAWGLWPRPLAPSDASEGPSLLLLAAAGKKFQTEEQAKAFLETLTEEHKKQLQRRHYRVATQMLHVPPFEPLPREKFRYEVPPERELGDAEHPALRLYSKKLLEQEKQLMGLQVHDVVFTNLYTKLRELFPERSDAMLYRMCKVACGLAKRQGLPRVLEPLRRRLEDARFSVARERRKICTGSEL